MSLTGISPSYPLPGSFREFFIGAGDSPQGAADRYVLLIGNKTTAGSETVDTIDTSNPIQSDDDAIARFGRRSEMLAMYRKAVAVDPAATYFAGVVAESGGTQATVAFTFATTATDATDVEISFQGEKAYASVSSGDTATVIATAVAAAINQASEGTWQATAANGGTAVVTVTASLKGPRHGLLLGSSANVGMRMRFLKNVTTTVSKGALSAGTTEDDGTAVIAAAALGEFWYIASPWHTTSALSATDNQTGELVEMCKTQNLPINGKEMTVTAGLVGTQAQSVTVATSTNGGNSVLAKFFWQKNSDWSSGMLAAHWTATLRAKQVAYPAANLNGHRSSDALPFQVPPYFVVTDRPSRTDLVSCANNGVTAVASTPTGAPYVSRDVTSRSLNAQGNNDYKAREGHTFSVMSASWRAAQARWQAQKQPNVMDDPVAGSKPLPLMSYPSQLKALLSTLIDDLAGPRPLGVYPGPLLDPSPASVAKMKNSIVVLKSPASLQAAVDWIVVEHLLKDEWELSQTNAPY